MINPTPAQGAPEHGAAGSQRRGVALCLSGGGYRAALFHLGALRRLNELGILVKVDTISAVSGGSIVAALLADEFDPWPRVPVLEREWEQGFAARVQGLARKNIRTLWLARRIATLRWFDSSVGAKTLERRYAKTLTDLALADMAAKPRFVFCATDMSFGVNWVSERSRVGDYQAGYAAPPPSAWTLSRAVAASSCFPPVFAPIPIELTPEELKGGEAKARTDRGELINRLRLTDGGVYDNLALEPVWKSHSTVLVSDGGATFDFAPDRGFPSRLGRYLTVQGNQAGSVRKRWLIDQFDTDEFAGTFWGIGAAAADYPGAAPSEAYSPELVEETIAQIRTDLDCFSEGEQKILENHGYVMANQAITDWSAELRTENPPLAPPHREYLDEDRVRKALAESHKRRLLGRWRKPWG